MVWLQYSSSHQTPLHMLYTYSLSPHLVHHSLPVNAGKYADWECRHTPSTFHSHRISFHFRPTYCCSVNPLCTSRATYPAAFATGQEAQQLVTQLHHDSSQTTLSHLLHQHHSIPLDTGQISLLGTQTHAVGSQLVTTLLLQITAPLSYLTPRQVCLRPVPPVLFAYVG